MKAHQVYLASSSPRRRELLDQIDISYTVIRPDVDESRQNDTNPQTYTQRIADAKAQYAKQIIDNNNYHSLPIIAADTAVVVAGKILGKPKNFDDAVQMLTLLSDRSHEVCSSICVINGAVKECVTQTSRVSFRKLSQQEIQAYWLSGEPQDKAGAYAVQGRGAAFISHLSGSYSGVMGLPLFELMQLLVKTGFVTQSEP